MLASARKVPQPRLASVVIPCYNAERFLAETIESALAQTYDKVEIIVIDDGSTDNCVGIIRSYGDRIRAEFGPNQGASAARNLGMALAHGEFIQYLDADDLLMPDAVERRTTALQKYGADVAYSDWERFVEVEPGVFEMSERIVRRVEDVHRNPEIAVITDFWAPPAALTYRRSIVDKVGGWKEWLPIIQDARFLQDAVMVGGRGILAGGGCQVPCASRHQPFRPQRNGLCIRRVPQCLRLAGAVRGQGQVEVRRTPRACGDLRLRRSFLVFS
jgi:cellulose synthase/poly-beta-1,6-N-acetylglucosamine synthase-like glycosyltransferase